MYNEFCEKRLILLKSVGNPVFNDHRFEINLARCGIRQQQYIVKGDF